MKASEFEYEKPGTLEAALARLATLGDGAELLAGGQSLMPMMNFRIAAPRVLLDLNGIADLAGISVAEGWLTIGAMTRYRDLEASDAVATAAPLIARALPHIAHPAIRNRGTIGGSVALADPAAEMPALLLALGGQIVLRSATGQRIVAADDFFLGVYDTARLEAELVTEIRVPLATPGTQFGFHEVVRRHGDYAMAGCAIAARTDLSEVRLAVFGVANRALRVAGAEAALAAGAGLDAAVAALDAVEFEADLTTSRQTKRHLAGIALRRAWAEVAS